MAVGAPRVSAADAAAFLSTHHGRAVSNVEPLSGGFWSAAYGYQLDAQELVARFGSRRDWFEMDRAAKAFDRPDLPVPAVLDVGDAFGAAFAISERRHGRFLENVDADDAATAALPVERLLAALRATTSTTDAPSAWYPPGGDPSASTWRQWLLAGLVDDPARPVHGWRRMVAADPACDALFEASAVRVRQLTDACPERRDLVHGDLLHQNVFLTEDLSAVSAVFSWKCSVLGDFLFDVAWCTFWGPWHPGIAAIDVWRRTWTAPELTTTDRLDAAARHHCYELQIGCTHLGWSAWTGDADALRDVATRLEHVLERGPLALGG